MKRSVFLLSLLFSYSSMAETAVSKIGFVNFDNAIKEENEAKKFIADLEKEKEQVLKSEQEKTAAFQKKVEDYKKTSASLTPKAKEEKEMALTQEMSTLQQSFQLARLSLQQKEQSMLADLETKNRLLVKSIAEQNGYGVVLNMAAVVYASEKELKANDITSKLVEQYNKAYAVKPAAKAPPKK